MLRRASAATLLVLLAAASRPARAGGAGAAARSPPQNQGLDPETTAGPVDSPAARVLSPSELESAEAAAPACCARLPQGFSSPLPVVVVDSGGALIPWRVDGAVRDTPVRVCTCSPGDGAAADFSGLADARVRGSSSAKFGKKSFKVDLKATAPLLGMPKDTDWVLYGPEQDPTLGGRDVLAYALARASGRWAPRTAACELFLVADGAGAVDAARHYAGVYVAAEAVKRGKGRVDVKKWNETDLSGGFLLEYTNNNVFADDVSIGPLRGGWEWPVLVRHPAAAPPAARAYALDYLQRFSDALDAPGFEAGWRALADEKAFLDYFLLAELTKNPDAYRGSTKMYKDAGGPLAMGPMWDVNEAFGACCGYPLEGYADGGRSAPGVAGGAATAPQGFRFNVCEDAARCAVEPRDGTSRWFRRLWMDPAWRLQAAARWAELRAGPWADAALRAQVEGGAAALLGAGAVRRNHDRWAGDARAKFPAPDEAGFQAAVGELLAWTLSRAAWLDAELEAEAAATRAGAPRPRRYSEANGAPLA